VSTLQQFDIAERLEAVAERIYRALADHFSGDAEARLLFEQLADEERQHALRVQMVRTRYLRDSDTVTGLVIDVARAREILAHAERIQEDVSRQPPTTVDEACRLAGDLEEELSLAHAEIMTKDCPQDLRRLLESLAKQDKHHAALLRKQTVPPAEG